MTIKRCPRCERHLPLEQFTNDRHRPDGHAAHCRDCHYDMRRTRARRANPTTTQLAWQDRASCLPYPKHIFYPTGTNTNIVASVELAQRICDGCPVRVECHTYATATGETEGVWGGVDFAAPGRQQRRGRYAA